jgi:toxin ParE1/3/4
LKPVKIVLVAEQEFREAASWYRDRDHRVAERFANETSQTLRLIETFHQIGSRVPGVADSTVRRMPIHTFPYHIVFVDVGDSIEVIAFAHHRRQPAYFASRIRRS